MRIVTCMGSAWKLTDRAFVNLMEAVERDDPWKLSNYGTLLANKMVNVTDMTPEEARHELENLK